MNEKILAKLHHVMIEILNEFVNICTSYNLKYFLTAGSLLGAIRHSGFIPWDDDMDIAMPRNDYEKFLDVYANLKESNYYLLSNRNSKENIFHYYTYAKFCKKNTIFAEDIQDPKFYSGIFIDIWPYDKTIKIFTPIQTIFGKFFWKLFRVKSKIDTPKNIILYYVIIFFSIFFTIDQCSIISKKIFQFFNKYEVKSISFFSGIKGYKKETHSLSTIFPLKKQFFEGNLYNIPCDFNKFLTQFYGNYMKLPPIDKRVNHNPSYIIFDTNKNSSIN
ncbi:MAG: LicD family protein [Treponema sp.]|nr:LicD family protein [Treponema sp.]